MSESITAGPYTKTFTGCIIAPDGVERHFLNGAYGRIGDLPAVRYPNGDALYYTENPKRGGFGQPGAILHRLGGPAVIRANGDWYFYVMGKIHRPESEGPAVWSVSMLCKKWFEDDKYIRSVHYRSLEAFLEDC